MMISDTHPFQYLLHRKLFSTQDLLHFQAVYRDDVDPAGFDKHRATQVKSHTDVTGTYDVWVMPDGISVLHFISPTKKANKWAAFETLERAEHVKHVSRWSTFARGHWTKDCPKEPGTYPVCARPAAVRRGAPWVSLIDLQTRKLQRVDGHVRDVSEFTPATHRSLWQGYWWSEALPLMLAPIAD
jgi:hypothetical protein